MHLAVHLVLIAVGLVCLGIPLTAIAVVYREELQPWASRARRALAFDPRHPALDPGLSR